MITESQDPLREAIQAALRVMPVEGSAPVAAARLAVLDGRSPPPPTAPAGAQRRELVP